MYITICYSVYNCLDQLPVSPVFRHKFYHPLTLDDVDTLLENDNRFGILLLFPPNVLVVAFFAGGF